MKHSNTSEYVAQNKKHLVGRRVGYALAIASIFMLIFAVVDFVEGVNQSQSLHILAESINREYAGEEYLFPSEGFGCRLEGRIVGTDFWYHDIIPAEFGDQIEIRARVSYLEQGRYSFVLPDCSSSAGLKLIDDANHDQWVTPDGNKVDYFSPDPEHVQYLACGIYEFGANDWFRGRDFSCFSVNITSTLLVIAPHNIAGLPRSILLALIAAILLICARFCCKRHESENPA